MSVSEQIEINIPSSPEDRAKLFKGIKEMSNAKTRIEAEQSFIKETAKALSENFDLDKKWINKLVADYHKDTFDKSVKEFEEYEALYETVVKQTDRAPVEEQDEE